MASKAGPSTVGPSDTSGPSYKNTKNTKLPDDDAERQGLLSGEPVSPDALDDEPTQPRSRRTVAFAAGGIILLLLGAAFGPAFLRMVDKPKESKPPVTGGDLHSNGTHEFKRTVLIVSIDGLRYMSTPL